MTNTSFSDESEKGSEDLRLRLHELERELDHLKDEQRKWRDKEAWWNLAMDNIRDYAIFMLDTQGRINSWNRGAERILGYKADEVLGKYYNFIFTPEDCAKKEPEIELKKALDTGRAEDETWHVRKDGSRFFASGIVNRICDKNGRALALSKVLRDVTDKQLSQQTLRVSEVRFRSLVEQAPLSIIFFSPEGRALMVNQAAMDLWGIHPEDVPDYSILQDPQLAERGLMPYLQKAFHAGEGTKLPTIPYDPEVSFPEQSKTFQCHGSRWIRGFIYPIKDDKGRIVEVILVQEDVTERRLIQDQFQNLQTRFALAQQVALIGTFEWVIPKNQVIWTSELEALFGLPPGGFKGRYESWLQMVHPEDQRRVEEEVRLAVVQGDVFFTEYRIVRPDGSVRWIYARGRTFPDSEGHPHRFIGINMDITERKLAEERLVNLNEELRRMNQVRSDFTSVVSHELKNPLSAISSGIDLVLEGVEGPVTEGQRDTLEIVQKNIERMSKLISNVLDFSKADAGKIELFYENIDLKELVGEVCRLMKLIASRKGIDFNCRVGSQQMVAACDPDKMKQILINLVDNAIKYTPAGGRITTRLYQAKVYAFIEVEDTGVGIKEEEQEKIFEMFSQGSTDRSLITGKSTGVGLAVCKRLIEAHGGTILVESSPGRGSKFIVSLPTKGGKEAGNKRQEART